MNITPRGPLGQKPPKERFTPLERRYYAWLHSNCVCCLTAYPELHIAHTGKKAMGKKAPLKTCLPIRYELHLVEEKRREWFWEQVGITDYLDWAVRLYDIFEGDDDPRTLLADMFAKSNKTALAAMLKGA
jgi:hypothetical protein